MTGFVRVLGNLGVLLFWIVLAANFMSHDWVEDTLPAQVRVHRRRRAGHEPVVFRVELRLCRAATGGSARKRCCACNNFPAFA